MKKVDKSQRVKAEGSTFGIPNSWWQAFGWEFSATTNKEVGAQHASGGGGVEAQVAVTSERALQVSTVWSCVKLIVETVASLPLGFYREDASSNRSPLEATHPLYRLLKNRPNPFMNAFDFRMGMNFSLVFRGNAYARIGRNARDEIVALTPLSFDSMQVMRLAGGLTYHYTHPNGVHVYPASEILHLKGFGADGVMGFDTYAYARQVLGLAISTDRYASQTFARGGRPTGVLTFDKFLNADQRVLARELYNSMTLGEASGAPLILEGGTKYDAISVPPDEMQMLQTRAFNISDIARFWRVPSHMVNDSEKTTTYGAGVEEITVGFLKFTLRPYLVCWEVAITDALLAASERGVVIIEHNVEGLLRATSAARATYYSTMVQNGLMTRNEARAKENLEQTEGGDELTIQSNLMSLETMTPASAASQPAIPEVPSAA